MFPIDSSLQHLQNTHEKLFKAFRSKHKDVPVIFVSKPDGARDEYSELRYQTIKQTYENTLNSGDNRVYLIDGREFYPSDIMEHCSVDSCHPTDLGFYFMAKKNIIFFEKHLTTFKNSCILES